MKLLTEAKADANIQAKVCHVNLIPRHLDVRLCVSPRKEHVHGILCVAIILLQYMTCYKYIQ